MKLRNKKTGEVSDLNSILLTQLVEETNTATSEFVKGNYYSLAELNEEWEDYEPKEPLIKDEKIRNLVREWIKLWETEDRWHVCDDSGEISIWRNDIELILPLSYGIKEGVYTVAELCGEEEE